MNRCDSGGWVVGNRPLPDDPVDHDLLLLPKLGCTRIRCRHCGQLVKSIAGHAMKQRGTEIDLKALYALADPSKSPLFERDSQDRFYFCHCTYHTEFEQHQLDEPDSSFAIPAALVWRCDGHPLATLPHDFDGAQITADNLAEIVGKVLHGWLPDRAREEDRPRACWLARLAGRLDGTAHVDTVAATTAAALDDDDPSVRMRALHFFIQRPLPTGSTRAHALLGGDRAKFHGVKDTMTQIPRDTTLEHALWRVAAPLVAQGSARDLARKEAIAPGKGSKALYDALAAGDTDWLLAHATDIAHASPDRADDLVTTFKYKLPAGVDGKAAIAAVRGAKS